MDDKVSAAGNGDAKLAIREKILNNFIVEDGHEERAGETAKSGANAEWTDAGKVIRIFMESNKVVGRESIVDRGGEVVVEDDAEEVSEGGEIGVVELGGVCVFVSVKGKVAPEVDGVSKWTRGGAFTHFAEGGKNMLRGEGSEGDVGVRSDGLCVSEGVVGDVGREEFFDMWGKFVGIGSKR